MHVEDRPPKAVCSNGQIQSTPRETNGTEPRRLPLPPTPAAYLAHRPAFPALLTYPWVCLSVPWSIVSRDERSRGSVAAVATSPPFAAHGADWSEVATTSLQSSPIHDRFAPLAEGRGGLSRLGDQIAPNLADARPERAKPRPRQPRPRRRELTKGNGSRRRAHGHSRRARYMRVQPPASLSYRSAMTTEQT